MSLAPELLAILVCPKCKSRLEHYPVHRKCSCVVSQLVYRVEDGIPVMLIDEAAPLDEAIYPPVSP